MTELLGPQKVYDAIAEMASEDKIAWVHFRNVRGQLPRFAKVFIDEGEVDMRRAMDVYRDNRFNGPYMGPHACDWEGVRGVAWEGVCDRVYPGVGGGGVWVSTRCRHQQRTIAWRSGISAERGDQRLSQVSQPSWYQELFEE